MPSELKYTSFRTCSNGFMIGSRPLELLCMDFDIESNLFKIEQNHENESAISATKPILAPTNLALSMFGSLEA